MPLSPGSLLGPYEIIAQLGAGGMGEVYRARDPRLDREVALKILPEQVGSDPERRARFEREARAAAQLHHPNILSILDVGSQGAIPYFVTELLKGETLRERLREGPIPTRKAIEYAAQVARGLGAAHDKGFIHRDIKPENIYLCEDGQVKILDFGLARTVLPDVPGSETTLSLRTATGVVVGTASYLSPEQARGQAVDARSDIFSLGTVLYEMLAGQRPFLGDSFADLVTAILREDPPPLPSTVKLHSTLDRIIRRCLEKSPAERFQSARDLAFQLDSILASFSSGSHPSTELAVASPRSSSLTRWFPWALASLLAIACASLAWYAHGLGGRRAPLGHVQFERITDFVGLESSPAISPDGKSVAFVSDSTGTRQIWVRLLSGGPPLQITQDADDHLGPRWSADSASIFYYTHTANSSSGVTVWKVTALGGAPRFLLQSLSEVDASHDGTSLAFFRLNDNRIELVRTGLNGENPQVLSSFPKTSGFRQPRWSPDDSAVAFIAAPGRWQDNIYWVSSKGGAPHQVTHDSLYLAGFTWLPDSSGFVYGSPRLSTLFYLPTQHLWEISRDGSRLQQLTFGLEGEASPDADLRGRIVLSRTHFVFDIWKFPVDFSPGENVRRAVRITHQTGAVQTPSLNPDGTQLAYLSDTGGHGNIWVMDLKSSQSRQVTYETDPRVALGVPLWSHDGANIAYARVDATSGMEDVEYWRIHPDGSGNQVFFRHGAGLAWSWDSRFAYYGAQSSSLANAGSQIAKINTATGEISTVRTDSATAPAPSPNDQTLYYARTLEAVNGLADFEIRSATPESGNSTFLAHISNYRVPLWQAFHPSLSSDGKWLAAPLNDQLGTNIWVISTSDGKMHSITDFGDRRTFIARHVDWSPDNHFVYAAVGDGDSDIFLLDGLLPQR